MLGLQNFPNKEILGSILNTESAATIFVPHRNSTPGALLSMETLIACD